MEANKDFDLVLFTDRNHGFGNDPYMIRRRWDYFVDTWPAPSPRRVTSCTRVPCNSRARGRGARAGATFACLASRRLSSISDRTTCRLVPSRG